MFKYRIRQGLVLIYPPCTPPPLHPPVSEGGGGAMGWGFHPNAPPTTQYCRILPQNGTCFPMFCSVLSYILLTVSPDAIVLDSCGLNLYPENLMSAFALTGFGIKRNYPEITPQNLLFWSTEKLGIVSPYSKRGEGGGHPFCSPEKLGIVSPYYKGGKGGPRRNPRHPSWGDFARVSPCISTNDKA